MSIDGYKRYLIVVLTAILAANLLDRVALGVLLQPIKVELSLSDTQLGFLTGLAFALFYSLMGIPIARWADRANRVAIISATTALWSVAVAMCGLATSFMQLLLIRVGVGVGEAGCIPTAQSLIADQFTRTERPRATSLYMMGYPLSAVLGYFLSGWLNEVYGWRLTFILIGLPGIALAAMAWLTLKEPRRQNVFAKATPTIRDAFNRSQPLSQSAGLPNLREVCVTLWANRTFRNLLFCWSVSNFFGYGITLWKPTFFIRSYGLGTGHVGAWFATIYGVSGLIGVYLGGEFVARYAVRNERYQLKAMAVSFVWFCFISAGIYVSPSPYLAFVLMGMSLVGIYAVYGPLFALIQTLVPPHMRAMAVAAVYLFANLIGMGLGPLLVGVLSDAFRPLAGEESLRYALLSMSPGYLWAGWHLWRASKTVTEDLQSASGNHQCMGAS